MTKQKKIPILYIWEEREGQYAHVIVKTPIRKAWIAQLESTEVIWRKLVKRGVIV